MSTGDASITRIIETMHEYECNLKYKIPSKIASPGVTKNGITAESGESVFFSLTFVTLIITINGFMLSVFPAETPGTAMPRILKIILMIGLVVAFGILALCVWGYRMVTGSLPVTQGELELAGLHAPVHIYRDGYHIPHILARDEHDLFFIQGFVTAQDRLWQMDMWRRASTGRLSEVLGQASLPADSLMVTIGIRRIVERIVPRLSSESKRMYQAFADGVNAFISQSSGKVPIEFLLLNTHPAPWRVEDCLAISRWLAWMSSDAWNADITLGLIFDAVGSEKAKSLFPASLPASWKKSWKGRLMSGAASSIYLSNTTGTHPSVEPGNAWVVSGRKSVTGKPLMANDPHLALTNPSMFYEIHLVGGGFDVSGFSLPGLPGVAVGHNQAIAWGMVHSTADDVDFFVLPLDPENPERYRYAGSYRNIDWIEEEIPVRMGKPVRIDIPLSVHGPIISRDLSREMNANALAVRWTGSDFSDEGLAIYLLNRAYDWDSFRDALRHYRVSPRIFVYADREGHVGTQVAGRLNREGKGFGYLPRNGEHPDAAWDDDIPFDALPSVIDPEDGWLVAAPSPIPSSPSSAPSARRRIEVLLAEKELYSVIDIQRIQTDVRSLYALRIIESIRPMLEEVHKQDIAAEGPVRMLLDWDGEFRTGSAEALIYETFYRKLMAKIYRDEMGDSLFTRFLNLHSIPMQALFELIENGGSRWCDDRTTEGKTEELDLLVHESLLDALSELRDAYGENTSSWAWGNAHRLLFRHPLGIHPLLGKSLNLGPFSVGGSRKTVNGSVIENRPPFRSQGGPAGRIIVDLSNRDNTISVLPTGQSGQALDEHYRDQIPLYIGNLYHPNLADTSKIVTSGWKHLILKPGERNE